MLACCNQIAKYKKNIGVLEYLDNNPEICQNSGFDIISKMKYGELLDEYFKSEEFERAIYKLREENEDEEYIREYIIKSKNYLNFFLDIPFKKKNNKFKIEENIKFIDLDESKYQIYNKGEIIEIEL